MNAPDPMRAAFAAARAFESGEAASGERPGGLPQGFELRANGVYRREDDQDGKAKWAWFCSPLRVVALTRDRGGDGWGRLVEVTDPDGRAHRWAIPARMFAGDGTELRAGLLDMGLSLGSGAKARNALTELVQRWQPRARARTADRLGWADEACAAFVFGEGGVLGCDPAEVVVYQHEHVPAAAAEMRPAGTLEGWAAAVAAPCLGNPLLVVAVSLAFAGPLLEPLGLDGGGLHLRGASSRGKSTAQRAAVSVWGSPRFLMSWRATANGLEGLAAACNSTLLALDEMGEVAGREAGAAAYMLANGQGKARADRSGRARAAARWRVCILSSGELGLADKMAEAGGRIAAGQAVRLLDVAADGFAHGAFAELHGAADGAAFATRLNAAAAEHYGTAGPAFVAAFLGDREAALAAVRLTLDGFAAMAAQRFGLDAEGQVARAVGRFAVVAAAGELATRWGLTGWPAGTARDAALDVLGLWLKGRGGGGAAEAREAVERTRAFLVAHGASRFEHVGGEGEGDAVAAASARPVFDRAGWRIGATYYVAADPWREMHAGADPQRAARHVADAGFLETDGPGRWTKRAPRCVPERPRCYAVKGAIMGTGDD